MLSEIKKATVRGTNDGKTIPLLFSLKTTPEPGNPGGMSDYDAICKCIGVEPGTRGGAFLYAMLEAIDLDELVPEEESKKVVNKDIIVVGKSVPNDPKFIEALLKETEDVRTDRETGKVIEWDEKGASLFRALIAKVLKVKGSVIGLPEVE
jgi:hypothetical protein